MGAAEIVDFNPSSDFDFVLNIQVYTRAPTIDPAVENNRTAACAPPPGTRIGGIGRPGWFP